MGSTEAMHPMDSASVLARLTWHYLTPLLRKGTREGVQAKDVWSLPPSQRPTNLLARYEAVRAQHPGMRLHWLLARMFWRRWIAAGLMYIAWCISAGCQPWLIRELTLHVKQGPDAALEDGLLWVLLLSLCSLGYTFFINWKFHQLNRNGSSIRALLMTLLYRKSLRLSLCSANSSRGKTGDSTDLGVGTVTNLMSNDAERVFEMQLFLHYLWASPAFVVTLMVMMWHEIGIAALIGFVLLLLTVPLQAKLGKIVGRSKRRMMTLTDERTGLLAQLLKGMEIIKLNAWERPLATRIEAARERELRELRVVLYVRGIMRAIQFVLPSIIAVATLSAYVRFSAQRTLTLDVTVMVLSFITCIRFPLLLIPHAVALLQEGLVSLGRIEAFLSQPDSGSPLLLQDGAAAINVQRSIIQLHLTGSFTWASGDNEQMSKEDTSTSTSAPQAVLHDLGLHLTLPFTSAGNGKLIGVVGPVGAGKTSLMLSLMGELRRLSQSSSGDDLHAMRGISSVGYVAQTPAIVNDTVERNITFGLHDHKGTNERYSFNPILFQQCVELACLHDDLALLPGGAQAEIGERGINLSGGQKARVALARVLYHRAVGRCPIVILDDPLSAVDVGIAHRLFRSAICGESRRVDNHDARAALGSKCGLTIVVMSSHLQLLHAADEIWLVEGGKVSIHNDVEAALSTPSIGGSGVTTLGSDPAGKDVNVCKLEEGGDGSNCLHSPWVSKPVHTSSAGQGATQHVIPATESKLTDDELSEHGAVAMRVYAHYFDHAAKDYGGLLLTLVLFSYVVGQLIRVFCDLWLVWWSTASGAVEQQRGNTNSTSSAVYFAGRSTSWWLWTSLAWCVASIVMAFARSLWCAELSLRASRAIHRTAIKSIFSAPLLYHQQNPMGRTLNRLSTDLHHMDVLLPDFLYQFLDNAFILISCVTMAFASIPWFIVAVVPLLLAFRSIQQRFRATSRELMRIDRMTRSPLFSHFGRTLRERATVRAFGNVVQHSFIRTANTLLEENCKVFMLSKLLQSWISTNLNSCALVFGALFCTLIVIMSGSIDPVLASLAIVYCFQLCGLASFTIKSFVDVENSMTSTERLRSFLDIMSEEDTDGSKHGDGTSQVILAKSVEQALQSVYDSNTCATTSHHSNWPKHGEIRLKSVSLRYRPGLELALRDINLHIRAGERVGIVGRSGSGKSSLIAAVFRLFALEAGSIVEIDGIDTASFPLQKLRRSLTVIPQDPVLFSGTIRSNLDPFDEHTDDDVWRALEKVQMSHAVSSFDRQLQYQVDEDGSNFSHGQRQLLCIARALIKRCKVLFCDEATSVVDIATDKLVQSVLGELDRCTRVTIAHRIDTVFDSDRILVMANASVAEFDRPSVLLRRKTSLFASMMRQGRDKHSSSGQISST